MEEEEEEDEEEGEEEEEEKEKEKEKEEDEEESGKRKRKQCAMVQNNQESRRKYWAPACLLTLLTYMHACSAALICSLACSFIPKLVGK